MALTYENPVKPLMVATPSIRRRASTAVEAAEARARFRRAVAELADSTPGTLETKRAAIEGAIAARLIPSGPVPCLETIRKLQARWAAGAVSASDFRDDRAPRGPKPRAVSQDLLQRLEALAFQHGIADRAHLLRLSRPVTEELGERPLTAWTLRRLLAGIGLHRIAAARQGSRAAQLDALPRGTYPTKHAHDMWFLDEGDSRYFARGICRIRSQWISLRPSIILVRDHFSGAILAARVVDPTRRIQVEEKRSMDTGFDADDVLATLLSIADRDLAPAWTQDLAGYLPKQLRWDNAQQHVALEQSIFAPGNLRRADNDFADPWDDEEDEDLDTVRIPVRRPDRDGSVERMMGMVKRWIVGATGHVDEVIPVDRLQQGQDLGRNRALIATAERGRQTRLDPIPVDALLTVPQLQQRLDQVARRYNEEHVLRRHGLTPLAAARQAMPTHPRQGTDLVRGLGVKSFLVQREGIVVQQDGRQVAFEAVNNGVLLQLGASIAGYVDPLLRAVWLEQGRHLIHLRPQTEAAATLAARDVALRGDDPVRAASDGAAAQRAARLDAAHGAGTAESGRLAYEEARDRSPDARLETDLTPAVREAITEAFTPTRKRKSRGSRRPNAEQVIVGEPTSNILDGFDPERLIRPAPATSPHNQKGSAE